MSAFQHVHAIFQLLFDEDSDFLLEDWDSAPGSPLSSPPRNQSGDPVDENRPSLLILPKEIIADIFTLVEPRTASRLSSSCTLIRNIAKSPSVKVKWLLNRYGHKHVIEGSLKWTKLLDPITLDCLFKIVTKVPRYVIQRAFTRFKEVNKPGG
jgi:hypothetical protein